MKFILAFFLTYTLALSIYPLLAASDKHAPQDKSRPVKTVDDIEVIVESDKLCNPQEETQMPRYY